MWHNLNEYQKNAVAELGNGKILCGGVGSGKSRTAVGYFWKVVTEKFKKPRDLCIITTARKRDTLDWNGTCALFGLSIDNPEDSIGGIRVIVDSWNNIKKYEDVNGAFFIFDEQKLVGSGAWVKSFYKIVKRNGWVLLSGTPGDVWADYIPVFVANGFYRNKSDFTTQHCVYSRYTKYPSIDRYVGTKKLERLRRSLLVDIPSPRHTVRHNETVMVEYDKPLFLQIVTARWNPYKDQPIKDVSELGYTTRKAVNSDPSRVEALSKLLVKHPRLIVFYNFTFEVEILRKWAEGLAIPYAEWNGQRHEEVPETNAWVYFVQYTAGAEAWECTETNAIAFYSLNYSWKVYEQSKGRIDRMNTPFTDLYYYTLKSLSPIDVRIWRALQAKKSFNQKAFFKGFEVEP